MNAEEQRFYNFSKSLNTIRIMIENLQFDFVKFSSEGSNRDPSDAEKINQDLQNFYSQVDDLRKHCKYIRCCKSCGKPFITERSDAVYCSRPNHHK